MPSRRGVVMLLMLAALAGPPARAASDSGAFVMTMGRDTIGLERFTRSAGGAEGTLLFVPAGIRVDYSLEILPDGSTHLMETAVRPASAP